MHKTQKINFSENKFICRNTLIILKNELEQREREAPEDGYGHKTLISALLLPINAILSDVPPQEISRSIHTLISTIDDFVEIVKQLCEANEAEIRELHEKLESTATPSAIDEKDFEKLIEDRLRLSVQMNTHQEELENEREELKVKINQIEKALSAGIYESPREKREEKTEIEKELATLDLTIKKVIEDNAKNDENLSKLKSYKNALALLKQGFPEELLE